MNDKRFLFCENLDLFVRGRISEEDAARQTKTARELLRRLNDQAGVILADEVGMGKTFVALSVAASSWNSDPHNPIVVMIPTALKEKWKSDAAVFRDKCIPEGLRSSFRFQEAAETAVDFLKLLDDPPDKKNALIFLTHGAMSRGVSDGLVKLALIQRAIHRRRDIDPLRRALYRFSGDLIQMSYLENHCDDVWEKLLNKHPSDWFSFLKRIGYEPKGDDDPVPATILEAIENLNTDPLFGAIQQMPSRESPYLKDRLTDVRRVLNEEIKELWGQCLSHLKLKLPLLILDEAHHLKNSKTRFASLFQDSESEADQKQTKRGPLQGVFERMVFLTATPFQLGHHELCSVLDRFEGISWNPATAPASGCDGLKSSVNVLREKLDLAQNATTRLDNAWKNLSREDLVNGDQRFDSTEAWWSSLKEKIEGLSPTGEEVWARFCESSRRMKDAEALLKPWMLRHLKPRNLSQTGIPRREKLMGDQILGDKSSSEERGLKVEGEALLPFLLAARAVSCSPEDRPVFSEGLASSYEAFLHTRRQRQEGALNAATDTDDDVDEAEGPVNADNQIKWYLDRIQAALPEQNVETSLTHPKVFATVQKTIELWKKNEKVVVFCHYVATGRILRQAISHSISAEIIKVGSEKLRCKPSEVFPLLDKIGDRFNAPASSLRRASGAAISEILVGYPNLHIFRESLSDVIRRNLRTPSFLVRYFPLNAKSVTPKDVQEAFQTEDGSGLSLKHLLRNFFEFLSVTCNETERQRYLQAMESIQTGSMAGADVSKTYSADEIQGARTEQLLPNVRLVNGEIRQETRQKLMVTFNTPFYPEIIIASNVMAEGVDLHLNCRHIIHHDLCWNPSTLEQRTGRVDRIGAKAEKAQKPIQVYLPYVAETQDEKMCRVVLDRERWFKVVMGEKFKVTAGNTEKLAERLPLPEEAAEELAFRLEAA